MKSFQFLLACGLTSLVAACSSDTKPGSDGDGGDTGGVTSTGGQTGSGGAHSSGGTVADGGAHSSGGSSAGGTANLGGSAGRNASGGASSNTPDAGNDGATTDAGVGGEPGDGGLHIEHVFVIAMENHDQSQIVGDSADAPYINDTLIKNYASTSKFVDTLDLAIPSEPHYVLVESGTNAFADVTFTGDGNPSDVNSTASTEHLVTQMKAANVSWMSYQEGLDATSGACPIDSSGFYAPKHDPFIFFQDVSGSPPSGTNAYCVAHHAPASQLAADLASDAVAAYNFITPNLCNDMHGAAGCPNSNSIRSGDDWLGANLPALITYAAAHKGVVFVLWDEGAATLSIPFLAIGPTVKKNYVGNVKYTHGSVVKSVERIFGLPYLAKVAGENDFTDLFEPGSFP
ncbi:MAG TPA: alkaline phosphatase family protein [Polyangiaceae bacterium]|jgi:hypothetical protein|nr:alkaline phosphatase family protein [Polyangiaceae bacterium]